jgi:hypothetical protein
VPVSGSFEPHKANLVYLFTTHHVLFAPPVASKTKSGFFTFLSIKIPSIRFKSLFLLLPITQTREIDLK